MRIPKIKQDGRLYEDHLDRSSPERWQNTMIEVLASWWDHWTLRLDLTFADHVSVLQADERIRAYLGVLCALLGVPPSAVVFFENGDEGGRLHLHVLMSVGKPKTSPGRSASTLLVASGYRLLKRLWWAVANPARAENCEMLDDVELFEDARAAHHYDYVSKALRLDAGPPRAPLFLGRMLQKKRKRVRSKRKPRGKGRSPAASRG